MGVPVRRIVCVCVWGGVILAYVRVHGIVSCLWLRVNVYNFL